MRSPKILIPAVAAVAVVAAFYFLVLSPKRDEATTLDGQIATQQQQIDQSKALLASYKDAKSRYKENYATVARLGKAVPADDDVRSLLVQLNSAAVKSGVTFLTLKGNPDKLTTQTDLCGKTVAVEKGATGDLVADDITAQCKKDGKPAVDKKPFPAQASADACGANGRVGASNATL